MCAPDGFSLQTAQAVSEQSLIVFRNNLARLVRLSLLIEGEDKEHFVLHPLLFVFAEELAKERNLYQVAEERHTKYFVDFADKHRDLRADNLDAIESELNSLILTTYRLRDRGVMNYSFYLALDLFFQERGYWLQALDLVFTY